MTDLYRSSLEFNLSTCIECQVNIISMRFMKQSLIFKSLQTIWRDMACTQKTLILCRWVPWRVDKKKRRISTESDCFGWGWRRRHKMRLMHDCRMLTGLLVEGVLRKWWIRFLLLSELLPHGAADAEGSRGLSDWKLPGDFLMMTVHTDIGKRYADPYGGRGGGGRIGRLELA